LKPADRRGDSRTADRAARSVWLREDGDGVLLFVHLQPGARRTALCGEHGGRLKIAVAAPPLDGRANDALVEWLAERLGLPRRQVQVAAGLRSRDKTLRAAGIGADDALRRLVPE
jgi:hypothetical protein